LAIFFWIIKVDGKNKTPFMGNYDNNEFGNMEIKINENEAKKNCGYFTLTINFPQTDNIQKKVMAGKWNMHSKMLEKIIILTKK
jgi:hypothetical protein